MAVTHMKAFASVPQDIREAAVRAEAAGVPDSVILHTLLIRALPAKLRQLVDIMLTARAKGRDILIIIGRLVTVDSGLTPQTEEETAAALRLWLEYREHELDIQQRKVIEVEKAVPIPLLQSTGACG